MINYIRRKPLRGILLIGLLTLFSVDMRAQKASDLAESIQKIESLMRLVDRSYVDTVNSSQLTEKVIRSFLKELDPHSVYISRKDVQKMNEPLVGNFEGVGIQFNILDDTIMVVSPISGGPSEKLGIISGDRIVKVDDELIAGIGVTNKMVMDKLRGKKGTIVKVSIFRRGENDLIDYNIERDKIPIYSVDAGYMVKPGIGYIKLNRFAGTSMREIRNKLDTLENLGMQSLILDLRGNSGGYLQTAIDLADEFLSNRKLIVYTEGRSFPKNEKFATSNGKFEKGKLVVLVDNGSASASEIVSGAVQDWDRGLIIGRRSFGKGLVQKPYPLPDGSMVRLTIQRYYTPTGRCIQKPYEEYKNDYFDRLDRGEFFSKDSIDLPDSLIYYTPNDREVYGGGGIIPDIFIPVDTTQSSKFFTNLRRKGVFNTFTLQLMDKERDNIKSRYPDMEFFRDQYNISETTMNEFLAFAEEKGVEKDEEGYKTSEKVIRNLLKAMIARGIWKSDGYFYIVNDLNPMMKEAIKAIEGNTFEEMRLSYK